MKRRWLLLGMTMLVVAIGALFLQPAYWQMIGWRRGEAFYDGRPTSYWAHEVYRARLAAGRADAIANGYSDVRPLPVRAWEGITGTDKPQLPDGFLKDDDALPVLVQLLQDQDYVVRAVAARILGLFGPRAFSSQSALLVAATDDDQEVRQAAAAALSAINPPASPAE